jgi:hypothetical protein
MALLRDKIEILGSKAFMYLGRHGGGWQVFDENHEVIELAYGRQGDRPHIENFLQCVRSGARPNADVEQGHLSVNGTVAPVGPLPPIQRWRQQWFGTTNNAGNAADPFVSASDGMPNLLKYALGLNPLVAVSNPVVGDGARDCDTAEGDREFPSP